MSKLELAKSLLKNNCSIIEIVTQTGFSANYIYYLVKRHHIDYRSPRRIDYDKVDTLLKEGRTKTFIADELGCTITSIIRYTKTGRGASLILPKKKRDYIRKNSPEKFTYEISNNDLDKFIWRIKLIKSLSIVDVYRLCHLYEIHKKRGASCTFRMNMEQQIVYMWNHINSL